MTKTLIIALLLVPTHNSLQNLPRMLCGKKTKRNEVCWGSAVYNILLIREIKGECPDWKYRQEIYSNSNKHFQNALHIKPLGGLTNSWKTTSGSTPVRQEQESEAIIGTGQLKMGKPFPPLIFNYPYGCLCPWDPQRLRSVIFCSCSTSRFSVLCMLTC